MTGGSQYVRPKTVMTHKIRFVNCLLTFCVPHILEYQDFYNTNISKFDYQDIFSEPSHPNNQGIAEFWKKNSFVPHSEYNTNLIIGMPKSFTPNSVDFTDEMAASWFHRINGFRRLPTLYSCHHTNT